MLADMFFIQLELTFTDLTVFMLGDWCGKILFGLIDASLGFFLIEAWSVFVQVLSESLDLSFIAEDRQILYTHELL